MSKTKRKPQTFAPDLSAAGTITPGRGFLEKMVGGVMLVDPERVAEMEGNLQQFVNHERFEDFATRMDSVSDDDYWPQVDSWEARFKPYNVVNSILQVPVMGTLVNRMGYQVGRYATGYEYIERAVGRGGQDANVKGIAYIHDSGGGEAAGNFELCDKLAELANGKPTRAFVADASYSGSYSIATVADEIVVTRSGGTGSVGVVTMHVDMSGALTNYGMKVTFIKAGKFKVDGNRFEALSESAQERIQSRIDKIYGVFTSTVAENRGMSDDAVRKTEALTYDADESVEVGFADRIGVYEDEVSAFELEVAQPNGDSPMAKETDQSATITQDDVTKASTDAVATERSRFSDVMASDKYKGNETQATKMLSTTDLSAEQIIDILPEAKADEPAPKGDVTAPNHFKDRMDAEGGPEVGAGDDTDAADENTPQAHAARIVGAGRMSQGLPATPAKK
jgi:signal peptide peptidase SppA